MAIWVEMQFFYLLIIKEKWRISLQKETLFWFEVFDNPLYQSLAQLKHIKHDQATFISRKQLK